MNLTRGAIYNAKCARDTLERVSKFSPQSRAPEFFVNKVTMGMYLAEHKIKVKNVRNLATIEVFLQSH